MLDRIVARARRGGRTYFGDSVPQLARKTFCQTGLSIVQDRIMARERRRTRTLVGSFGPSAYREIFQN